MTQKTYTVYLTQQLKIMFRDSCEMIDFNRILEIITL